MAELYRILTLNSISGIGLERFPARRYTVSGQITDPDAVLVRSHDMHRMDIPRSVRAIARAGAGTNNIPIADMSKRGVPVFNAPGANANAVKELVIAAMLIAARNLVPAVNFVEGLEGDDAALNKAVENGKQPFVGTELPGHTLGIIGLGKVGSLVADAAIKLGMNVVGYDPHITVDAAWSLPSQVRKAQTIEEVLKGSDYVTLHVPLLDSTRNMVSAETHRSDAGRRDPPQLRPQRTGRRCSGGCRTRSEAPALLHVRLPGCGTAGPSASDRAAASRAHRRVKRKTIAQ